MQAFHDLMFNQSRPAESIASYAGRNLHRQHNPHVGDGKQAFIDFFERRVRGLPEFSGELPLACLAEEIAALGFAASGWALLRMSNDDFELPPGLTSGRRQLPTVSVV